MQNHRGSQLSLVGSILFQALDGHPRYYRRQLYDGWPDWHSWHDWQGWHVSAHSVASDDVDKGLNLAELLSEPGSMVLDDGGPHCDGEPEYDIADVVDEPDYVGEPDFDGEPDLLLVCQRHRC